LLVSPAHGAAIGYLLKTSNRCLAERDNERVVAEGDWCLWSIDFRPVIKAKLYPLSVRNWWARSSVQSAKRGRRPCAIAGRIEGREL